MRLGHKKIAPRVGMLLGLRDKKLRTCICVFFKGSHIKFRKALETVCVLDIHISNIFLTCYSCARSAPDGSTYPHGPPRTLSVTQETQSDLSSQLIALNSPLSSRRQLMWME